MPYTTNELIAKAFYISGVVSREFSTVSGGQISDGLALLNDILTEKDVDDGMIPFEDTFEMAFLPNVEKYFIPDLIAIDTITFFLQSVRYSLKYEKRNAYFGQSRAENISTLPYEWYFERAKGGGNLYIYFKPNEAFPVIIHGSFRLEQVDLFQDLSLIFDRFYLTYLKYCLADRICTEYGFVTPHNVLRQLGKYESFITKKSRLLDLSIAKTSTLQRRGSLSYAFVNLSHGFVPPS